MTALTPIEPRRTSRRMTPTVDAVVTAAAREFDTTVTDILSDDRFVHIIPARHVAMWALRERGWVLPVIGRVFSRDHSTVHRACRKIRQHIADDTELGRTALRLRDEMEAGR